MKYRGIELKEFDSSRPVVFEPPKKMIVQDSEDDNPVQNNVYAYLPKHDSPVKCTETTWCHCAEIPGTLKPRRATNYELAKWLAKGNGQFTVNGDCRLLIEHIYDMGHDQKECSADIKVRKWIDAEWHEPTVDYLGLDK